MGGPDDPSFSTASTLIQMLNPPGDVDVVIEDLESHKKMSTILECESIGALLTVYFFRQAFLIILLVKNKIQSNRGVIALTVEVS